MAAVAQERQGGQAALDQRDGLRVGHRGGYGDHAGHRHPCELGVAALGDAGRADHPVPHGDAVDPRVEGHHLAGELGARDRGAGPAQPGGEPGDGWIRRTQRGVGPRDRHCPDAQEDLAGPRRGHEHLLDAEHLRRAVAPAGDGTHRRRQGGFRTVGGPRTGDGRLGRAGLVRGHVGSSAG
nr:hypothetical protein [Actinotalea fermentans]